MIAPESAHLAIGTSEQGKPLSKALGEVDIGGAYVEFYTEETRRIYGEPIPSPRRDARLLAIATDWRPKSADSFLFCKTAVTRQFSTTARLNRDCWFRTC